MNCPPHDQNHDAAFRVFLTSKALLYGVVCVILFSACAAALCTAAAADEDGNRELRCSGCGTIITGTYISSGGRIYCSKACWKQSRPVCTVCGKKIYKGGFTYKGKYVCSRTCMDRLRPTCAVCGKPVKGETGVKSNGKYYCSMECFRKSLPRCLLCGKRITHQYKVNGRIYCKECFDTPKCLQCGCPAGTSVLPDGRPFCPQCKNRGIIKREKALAVFREVRNLLRKECGVSTAPDIEFHLVNKPGLEKVSGRKEIGEDGLYRRITVEESENINFFGISIAEGLNRKQKIVRQIYVLTWLDRPHFRQVCAHELMHDWTETHFPDLEDIEIIEGISEYAAYICNRYYGCDELNSAKLNNKDPVYGAGFRLVLKADRGKGIEDIGAWISEGTYKKDLKRLKKKLKKSK